MTVAERETAEGKVDQAQVETERSPMPFLVLGGALVAAAVAAALLVMLSASNNERSTPASAAPKAPAAAQPSGKIGVTLKEFSVSPTSTVGKAGKVSFSVRNSGKIKHEFVVLRTPKSAGDLLKGSEADETGNVGEIGNVPAGRSKSLSLKLRPGHYDLICNLPGHYQAGQHADFRVR